MQLAEVLDYTHVAAADLPSGGRVTVIERDPYLSLVLRRGAAGEEEWHAAHSREHVPVVLALCGVLDPGDRWRYVVPSLDTATPYHRDCAEIRVAVADRRVPPFFAALLDDRSHAGVERVRECAAIARSGAVAACVVPA
jgi:hypothetical protein